MTTINTAALRKLLEAGCFDALLPLQMRERSEKFDLLSVEPNAIYVGTLHTRPYMAEAILAAVNALPALLDAYEAMAGVRQLLADLATWAGSQCPVENDQPKICPLCNADVDFDVCRAVPAVFPPALAERIRAMLAAKEPTR